MKLFTLIYAIILILLTGCGAPERKPGEGYVMPSQDMTFKSLRSLSYTTGTLSEVLYSDNGSYYLSPDIRDILELNNVHVDIFDEKGSIKSTLDSDSAYYYLSEKDMGGHLRKSGDIDMYGSEDKRVHYNGPSAEVISPTLIGTWRRILSALHRPMFIIYIKKNCMIQMCSAGRKQNG